RRRPPPRHRRRGPRTPPALLGRPGRGEADGRPGSPAGPRPGPGTHAGGAAADLRPRLPRGSYTPPRAPAGPAADDAGPARPRRVPVAVGAPDGDPLRRAGAPTGPPGARAADLRPALTPGVVDPVHRPSAQLSMFAMTCLTRVYSSSPYIDRSLPWPDFLKPPCGISATSGMWQLTHTQPKSSRRLIRIARPKSFVHTLEARPYSTPLAQAAAWSSSENFCTVMTGPKISFWIASSSWCRPETTRSEERRVG